MSKLSSTYYLDLTRADRPDHVPVLLQPVILGSASKNPKVCSIAVSCLQRLVASKNAVGQSSIPLILQALRTVFAQGVEVQLKILQTLVSLLSNASIHDDLLAETLLLCFRLQESKIGVVSSTAAATLRQLVMVIFEGVVEEDALSHSAVDAENNEKVLELDIPDGIGLVKLRPCAADAYHVFQDLCLLVSSSSPGGKSTATSFLKLNSLPRTFGLELVESVLSDFHAVFSNHPELLYLLRSLLSPLLIRSLAGEVGVQPQFSITLRLMRVIFLLLKVFDDHLVTESEIFFQMFIKVVAPGEVEGTGGHPLGVSTSTSTHSNASNTAMSASTGSSPAWMRVLALEIFRGLCGDFDLLRRVWNRYDAPSEDAEAAKTNASSKEAGVLVGLLNALSRLASEKPALLGIGQALTMGSVVSGQGGSATAVGMDYSMSGMIDALGPKVAEMAASAASSVGVGGVNAQEFSVETSTIKLQWCERPHYQPDVAH